MRRSYLLLVLFLSAVIIFFPASPCACSLPEDVNNDGKVDILDAMALTEAFNSRPGDNNWNPNADIVADGKIDILDAIRLAMRLGAYMPVASFTESAHTVPVGAPIEFDPSDSYDPDGTLVLYEWDFDGDGVYDESTESPDVVTFAYLTPGTYNVTLRVTDNDDITATATDTKTITPMGVIPEVPLGTIVASAAMIIALVAYVSVPKWRRKRQSVNL